MQRDLNVFKKGSCNFDCCYNYHHPPQISRNTTRICRDWQSNNSNYHILSSDYGMGPVTATSTFSLNSLNHSIDFYIWGSWSTEKLNNMPRVMSSWPGSNPVFLTFVPVGLRDWFLLKRKSDPPGQESLNWGENDALYLCKEGSSPLPFSSAVESPGWEWGEALLLDSGDHLPTPLMIVSRGSL